ncbi:BsaA family SipW-dependent biofilm matrix protein [Candidatus Saccharibacteria bacterium]|nr:BsaA family SipW-dependent biofilm matrix protein [Candidatus Saccharibacteria bacterium]
MKRFKNLSLKKKRTLAIAGVSVLCLVIVGTIAFNQDSIFFNNLFKLADDNVEFVETFDSPDDWQPCQEIDKTAIATNKNATPRYVRMKINEYWRTKDTTTPSTDHETTDLPLTWNDSGTDKHYAVINTQNDDKWELKNDGWYYYKTTLAQNESTLSLLKSVTFNCEVNTVGEIRYSVDGKTGESVPTEYADATYHLYITFQMSDESLATRMRLYDQVASETQGLDTNVRLYETTPKDYDWLDPTGSGYYGVTSAYEDGVFTYQEKAGLEHPVYYYRGMPRNNFVKLANYCWRIVRTTETGGTKIIYAGEVKDGGRCGEGYNYNDQYEMSISYTPFANYMKTSSAEDSAAASTGYMYNPEFVVNGYDESGQYIPGSERPWDDTLGESVKRRKNIEGMVASKGITYESGRYSLTGDKTVIGSSDYADAIGNSDRYRYTCWSTDANAQCEKAALIIVGDSLYVDMINGDMQKETLDRVFSNKFDSKLKESIDSFYEQNLTSVSAVFEDTIWCNDRTITSGPYIMNGTGVSGPTTFSFMNRFSTRARPKLDCDRPLDRFTVSDQNGNGDLKYPIATITADEAILAGLPQSDSDSLSVLTYLSDPFAPGTNYSITMTPFDIVATGGNGSEEGHVVNLSSSWRSRFFFRRSGMTTENYRPMVSVKYDTYIASGNGTAANPYTLEW